MFGPSVEPQGQETPTVGEKVCPKCGYPMRSDSTKCPNCNYSPASSTGPQSESPSNAGYQRRPTRMAADPIVEEPVLKQTRKATNSGFMSGTVNPYMQNFIQEPMFVLEPIQRMNERKPVEPVELRVVKIL